MVIKRRRQENIKRNREIEMDIFKIKAAGLSPKYLAERLQKLGSLKAESALRGARLKPADFAADFAKDKNLKEAVPLRKFNFLPEMEGIYVDAIRKM